MTIIKSMNLGVQLRVYRKSKGHSVKKVADITGIHVDKLYKWEKGTRPSDAEDLLKIKDYLAGKLENDPKVREVELEISPKSTTLSGAATLQDLLAAKDEAIRKAEEYAMKMEEHYKDVMARLKDEQANVKEAQVTINETLKSLHTNLARGQQEIKEQILVTATAAVQQLSGQVPAVPMQARGKGVAGKKKEADGDGKGKGR